MITHFEFWNDTMGVDDLSRATMGIGCKETFLTNIEGQPAWADRVAERVQSEKNKSKAK